MTKQEYIHNLNNMLRNLPEEDRQEIVYDYEEHFRQGLAEGKTEQEISLALGDVKAIARQFAADYHVKRAETDSSPGNILQAVLASMGLGFFNLVFVMGPFLAVVGVLFGLFAASISLTIAGLAALVGIFISPVFPQIVNIGISIPFGIFFSIGLTSLGLLCLVGNVYLTRAFFKATAVYLKWNLNIITRRSQNVN